LIATGGDALPGFALDANNVYWTATFEGKVFTCPRSGCGSTPVVFWSGGNPRGIVSDGKDVYWATDGAVMKCPVTGCNGAAITLAPAPDANGIAVDATNVYWTKSQGGVMKCAKTGCGKAPTTLATGTSGADIAVDATDVYWASPHSSEVFKCAKAGCNGAPTVLASSQAYALALDDVNVYWAAVDSVQKCAKTGCAHPTVLASGQESPADIVVDATRVYWTDRKGEGAIRVLPK
jgi:hypothetical protein